MKQIQRNSYLVLVLLLLSTLVSGCGQQKDVVTNSLKTQNKEEKRIIALSVSLVEILEKLEVELVGVPKTQYDLSERMSKVEQVGLSMSPDLEKMAMLEPTHVLSVSTLKAMVGEKLESAGFEPIYLETENINQLKETILKLGEMFECKDKAEALLTEFEEEIDSTLKSIKDKESPKVLILFGFPGSYLAATPASFVGQMVELLGAVNVVTENHIAYASINLEELLTQKPDMILRITHGVKEDVLKMFEKEFKENPIWSQFEAVQKDKVIDLDDRLFNVSASLKTAVALKELASILYP